MENTPAIGPAEESDMFRKLAAILLIALALATLAVYSWAVMAPLTLSIGSGSVALVQNGAFSIGAAKGPTPILPLASTPGTALVATFFGDVVTSAPAGWVQLATATATNGLSLTFSIWIYLNNPGGILAPIFTVSTVSATTDAQLSEWANVRAASALETSGTATAIAGTTLTPSAGAAIVNQGDLAIAAWAQALAAPAVITFTTPSGWTRLKDNGASNVQGHDDIEYLVSPQIGVTLAPVLTSSGTSFLAAGAIVVLKAAPPATDQTAYLAY